MLVSLKDTVRQRLEVTANRTFGFDQKCNAKQVVVIVNYHCQHLICRCLASLEALGTLVSFCGFHDYTTLVKLPGAVIVFGIIRRQPKLVRAFFRGY